MFFEKIDDIFEIARQTNCAFFVIPNEIKIDTKNALVLQPEEKTTITIEQVHDILDTLKTKQNDELFIVIRPAELMGVEAQNAILKSLEETQDKVHFVLISAALSKLLPTILSRAEIFMWRGGNTKINEINADVKIKDLARRLLVSKPGDLVGLAEEICKKKDGVREHALLVLSAAVEMAYKSYFLTGKTVFLSKIPKLILAHDGISKNGHIKLHLVADLL